MLNARYMREARARGCTLPAARRCYAYTARRAAMLLSAALCWRCARARRRRTALRSRRVLFIVVQCHSDGDGAAFTYGARASYERSCARASLRIYKRRVRRHACCASSVLRCRAMRRHVCRCCRKTRRAHGTLRALLLRMRSRVRCASYARDECEER